MARVFISYRRDDSAASAGRIQDRLIRDLGSDLVFTDAPCRSASRCVAVRRRSGIVNGVPLLRVESRAAVPGARRLFLSWRRRRRSTVALFDDRIGSPVAAPSQSRISWR